MAQLPGRARGSAVDLPAQHQTASDPGTYGEHHQILDQRPSPFVERLRHSREGGVVVDEHRQAEPILEHTS